MRVIEHHRLIRVEQVDRRLDGEAHGPVKDRRRLRLARVPIGVIGPRVHEHTLLGDRLAGINVRFQALKGDQIEQIEEAPEIGPHFLIGNRANVSVHNGSRAAPIVLDFRQLEERGRLRRGLGGRRRRDALDVDREPALIEADQVIARQLPIVGQQDSRAGHTAGKRHLVARQLVRRHRIEVLIGHIIGRTRRRLRAARRPVHRVSGQDVIRPGDIGGRALNDTDDGRHAVVGKRVSRPADAFHQRDGLLLGDDGLIEGRNRPFVQRDHRRPAAAVLESVRLCVNCRQIRLLVLDVSKRELAHTLEPENVRRPLADAEMLRAARDAQRPDAAAAHDIGAVRVSVVNRDGLIDP